MEGFRAEIDDVHVGIVIADDALEIRAASERFLRDFGCTLADVEGIELTELVAASDRRGLLALDRALSQAAAVTRRLDITVVLAVGDVEHLTRILLERRGERWHLLIECIDSSVGVAGAQNSIFGLLRDNRRWATVLDGSADSLVFLDAAGRITDFNVRFVDRIKIRSEHGVLLGEAALRGSELLELLANESFAGLRSCLVAMMASQGHVAAIELHGRNFEFDGRPLFMPTQGLTGYAISLRDVTDRHQAEASQLARQREELRHHEAIIAAQQSAIRALSAPRIPIGKKLMVVPFVGDIDRQRMAEITHGLLEGLARAGTRAVILDITGVPHLDEGAVAGLVGASRAMRMIGVRALLTGVSPNTAQLLAACEFSPRDLEVCANLEDAIAILARKS